MTLFFSVLIGLVITLAILLGIMEWQQNKQCAALKKQKLISLSTILPNFIVYLLTASYWHGVYQFIVQYQLLEINGVLISLFLSLVFCDFSYYWEHRMAHKISFLWKLYHGTHHTGTDYNIPLAYRVNALNMLIAPLFYLPWILVGIDPLIVLGFQLFVFHYQGWLHTNLIGEIKGFDRWFNSPANHRMHHSIYHQEPNVNFGAVFMLWDKLFGTYFSPKSDLIYGINGRKVDDSYLGIYFDLWRHDCNN